MNAKEQFPGFVAGMAVAFLAAALTGCGGGGGGGGGESPPPAQQQQQEETKVSWVRAAAVEGAASGAVTGMAPITGEVAITGGLNPEVKATITCGGTPVPFASQTLPNTGGSFSIPPSVAYPGGGCSGFVEVLVKKVSDGSMYSVGQSMNFASAPPATTVPAYDKVAVAVVGGHVVLQRLTAPHVVGAVDKTGYPGQVSKTAMGEGVLEDCHIPFLGYRFTSTRAGLYPIKLNPVTGELTAWAGPMPAGYEFNDSDPDGRNWTWGPKWHWCMHATCDKPWGVSPNPSWYSWTDDGQGGYFYFDGAAGYALRNTAISQVLFDTGSNPTFGQWSSFTVMGTFSCQPKP